jgi:hypothetical protein
MRSLGKVSKSARSISSINPDAGPSSDEVEGFELVWAIICSLDFSARGGAPVAVYFSRFLTGVLILVRKLFVVLCALSCFAGIARAAERPTINLLMLEEDLRSCISGQIQTKIGQIQPVHDLSRAIRPPHLELAVICDPVTVEVRDQNGDLTPVQVATCASILAENPGADIAKRVKKMNLTGVVRRIHVQATTGQVGQQCRAISNQMIPRIFRWLGQGAAFK